MSKMSKAINYQVKLNLKQAVAFAILMEGEEGILGKSYNYIMEKLCRLEYHPQPEELLDQGRQARYRLWFEKWVKPYERKEPDQKTEVPETGDLPL